MLSCVRQLAHARERRVRALAAALLRSQYNKNVKPKVGNEVLILAGPDKGRAGTLLGVEGENAIVKLSTRELKVVELAKIAKAL